MFKTIRIFILFAAFSFIALLIGTLPVSKVSAKEDFQTFQHTSSILLSGKAGDSSVNLSWTDAEFSVDTNYRIYYSSKAPRHPRSRGEFVDVGNVDHFTVDGLINGTAYYFTVVRLDDCIKVDDRSNTVQLTPLDQIAPITHLRTSPLLPDGKNGWFVNLPKISLTANEESTIYYQWNGKSDVGWLVYTGQIPALEGRNILYYYAVDLSGNIEAINWQNFKVDTVYPGITTLVVSWNENQNGNVLSWKEVDDAAYYQIWRLLPSPVLLATVSKDSLSYVDQNVSRQLAYTYKIIAEDWAGNLTSSKEQTITVPALPVISPTISSQTTVSPQSHTYKIVTKKKITPAIGEGVSTVAQNTQEVTAPTPKAIAGEQSDNNEKGSAGWNRLLVALSILVIAAGIAVGGFYGYEWMNSRTVMKLREKKKKESRW